MSFSCTLHPVDPRVIQTLRQDVTGGRVDWTFLTRLWRQKQLINRVNQPVKARLQELLTAVPQVQAAIHLWGRPFLIYSAEPARINAQIARLYSLNQEAEIRRVYLGELEQFTDSAILKQFDLKWPRVTEPALGIERVVARLRFALKKGFYKELGMELGFILAQLVGAAYPYWHLGSYSLSFLVGLEIPGWEPPAGLRTAFGDIPAVVPYIPTNLERNLSAGLYLDRQAVKQLAAVIAAEEAVLLHRMAQKQLAREPARQLLQKIQEALAYAAEYHYGLLEASDIYEKKPPPFP